MLCHSDLSRYYKTMFTLVQQFGYSLTDLNDLIPYERDIYMDMIQELIREREAS